MYNLDTHNIELMRRNSRILRDIMQFPLGIRAFYLSAYDRNPVCMDHN